MTAPIRPRSAVILIAKEEAEHAPGFERRPRFQEQAITAALHRYSDYIEGRIKHHRPHQDVRDRRIDDIRFVLVARANCGGRRAPIPSAAPTTRTWIRTTSSPMLRQR